MSQLKKSMERETELHMHSQYDSHGGSSAGRKRILNISYNLKLSLSLNHLKNAIMIHDSLYSNLFYHRL
uniref:Uncharacterized protein n=1 Tax=Anguilla anguilla TaxID=7936 RepID=A0A0E9WDY3_ANGAN